MITITPTLAYTLGKPNVTRHQRPLIYKAHDNRRMIVVLPMPYAHARLFLGRHCKNIRPTYSGILGGWTITAKHLREVSEAVARRFGECSVVKDQEVREKCDTRCQQAWGDECNCACLGDNHGGSSYQKNWLLVGQTTLVTTPAEVIRRKYIVKRENI